MASKYGWIITKDHLVETGYSGPSEVGVTGPRGCEFTEEELNKGQLFRMYDDDDILYYTGRIVGERDGCEPLFDFGMPNAGCTRLDLRMPDGTWEHTCS